MLLRSRLLKVLRSYVEETKVGKVGEGAGEEVQQVLSWQKQWQLQENDNGKDNDNDNDNDKDMGKGGESVGEEIQQVTSSLNTKDEEAL